MESTKHPKGNFKRCKRLAPPTRTRAQLVAAWERPFDEGVSQCFLGRPLLEETSKSAIGRRATAATLQTRASRLSNFTIRSAAVDSKVEERARYGRIPQNSIQPFRYTVCLKPNLATLKFDGSVLIEFGSRGVWLSQTDLEESATTTVDRIVLNALDLVIDKAVWADETTRKQYDASVYLDTEAEQLILTFDQPMQLPGILIINFSGKINDTAVGFYRSNYTSPTGEEKYCGAAMFEPTFTRKCFPCWDEPGFKAKFELSLILSKKLTALSNRSIQAITPHRTNKSLQVIEFEATPFMSTNSLAFVIGEFDFIVGHVGSATDYVTIRIYAPLGQAEKGQFALDWTQSFLEFFEFYFDRPLEMRKLDIVSLASHPISVSGNWGLLTAHQSRLLQENVFDLEEANLIALAQSQAIAKQWIGNLVTMDWWSELWIVEGLTNFLKYLSNDYLRPELNIWHQFVADLVIRALEVDTLRTTHSLQTDVHFPEEIAHNFDIISSGKGAAVMRMLQIFVGEKTFQNGVQEYVKRFAYQNSTTKDFLQILEGVSRKPVVAVFETWIKHSGFPLIKVEATQFECNRSCRVVIVHQDPFCLDAAFGPPKVRHAKCHWIIPIQLSLSSAPSQPIKEFIMNRPVQKFRIMDTNSNEWFMLNPGFTGFYRVKYPPEMMGNFLQAIRTKAFLPSDRLGLLNDLHALASAGYSSATELLTMLESFLEEDDFLIWKEIDTIIRKMDILVQRSECYSNFKYFARSLFRKIYEKLGWNIKSGESSSDSKLRQLVLRLLLQFGHVDCRETGFQRFRQWLTGGVTELRGIAFQAGICDPDNNDEVFRTLVRHFKDSNSPQEKADIIQSFGFAESEETIMSILDFTASDLVTCEEVIVLLDLLMQNAEAKPLAWQYFTDNASTFLKKFSGSRLETRLVDVVTKYLGPGVKAQEVSAFFRIHQFPGTEKVVQESLDMMKIHSAWLKRGKQHITEYLAPFNH